MQAAGGRQDMFCVVVGVIVADDASSDVLKRQVRDDRRCNVF